FLVAGVYGTTTAATTTSDLLASLPFIRVGLLVGIDGGIARPDEGRDILLGDIVVSQPDRTTGGVCQYDLIKAKARGVRERKGFLRRPPTVLLNALSSIQADHELKDPKIPCFLEEMLKNPKMGKRSKQNPGYAHQGLDNDRLFKASCDHVAGPDCWGCDKADEIQRDSRDTSEPEIHYGTIASGNMLVKDAATRDRIVADVGENYICFEMEAAGLMNHFPCLVIRGICDYSDSHKNDRWQRYALATAAAYAKELLAYMPATEVQETKSAKEVLDLVQQQINGVQQTAAATKAATDSITSDLHIDKIKSWLCHPDPSTNANHARELRHEGTGCGKTILSATVLDHLAKREDRIVLSFFFDFSDTTKQTLDGMLRSLAFQLYQGGPGSVNLPDASFKAHRDGRNQPATKALQHVVCKMLVIQKKGCIVLDALDEATTRATLLLWMNDLVSRPELGHIQLICTSRPEHEFMRDIPSFIGEGNCLALNKESVNANIRSYVAAQLSKRRDFLNDEYGNALQAASLEGHQEIVKLLLDEGADVNAQGGLYDNALQAASLEGHQEIVKLLLDKGAGVNEQGGFYGNALQAASSKDHQEIVKLLLDKGAKERTSTHRRALWRWRQQVENNLVRDGGFRASLRKRR
ncbi:hypothetical protein QBC38DRAFT_525549, partial [Podospora fimiseda]